VDMGKKSVRKNLLEYRMGRLICSLLVVLLTAVVGVTR